jgi:hypothetical protein
MFSAGRMLRAILPENAYFGDPTETCNQKSRYRKPLNCSEKFYAAALTRRTQIYRIPALLRRPTIESIRSRPVSPQKTI